MTLTEGSAGAERERTPAVAVDQTAWHTLRRRASVRAPRGRPGRRPRRRRGPAPPRAGRAEQARRGQRSPAGTRSCASTARGICLLGPLAFPPDRRGRQALHAPLAVGCAGAGAVVEPSVA